jgi:hypothetical protein
VHHGNIYLIHHQSPTRELVMGFAPLMLVTALCGRVLQSPQLDRQASDQVQASSSRVKRGDIDDSFVKRGLELALIKEGLDAFRGASNREESLATAGALLKQYGPAYLITSLSFAACTYSGCYVAISRGVDVAALLARFGIKSAASERVGTAGIAYVCHKAMSPLRFPPTVALTPVVARWLGQKDGATANRS